MQKFEPSSQTLCKISGNGLTDLGHMAHTTETRYDRIVQWLHNDFGSTKNIQFGWFFLYKTQTA